MTLSAADVSPTPVTTVAPPLATSASTVVNAATSTAMDAQDLVEQAETFAAEVEAWGACVAEAARTHAGEAFDPKEACGETPTAADHGLGTAHAPGLEGKTVPNTTKVDKPDPSVKADDTEDEDAGDEIPAADKPTKPDKPTKADKPDEG
jgi:hypothetical protein